MPKPVDKLTVQDMQACPVWEYDLDSESEGGRDETWVMPVTALPVTDLSNRVIGAQLRLANGSTLQGILGNIKM